MAKTENIFEVLDLLRDNPLSSNEIQKELRISLPTVYRYIKQLRKQGYEIEFSDKKYRLVSTPEKNVKIKSLFSKKSQVISKKFINQLSYSIEFSLPAVISYKKPNSVDSRQYRIHPVELVMIAERYYLIAIDDKDGIIKEFRIDRIDKVKVEHSVHTVKPELYDVKFRVKKEMTYYYEDQFPGSKVEITDNGEMIVSFKVHSLLRAKRVIFPFMEYIEVLEPEELREDIKGTLLGMLKMYE